MKAFLLALAWLAATSATESNIAPWQHPEVVRVDCLLGRGSAFRVGPNMLLSVAHVTSMPLCNIGGKPFTVIEKRGDFTVLQVADTSRSWLKIDCGGYVKGHRYQAIGYARGLDTQTTIDLIATGEKDGQMSQLEGVFTVIPGQSGGPIIDEDTGEAVGTTNTFEPEQGLSGSVALSDTPVCKA